MKILFVVPYVPSLIRVRPYNLIRHLAARGHQVTVATLWTNAGEQTELDELRKHCAGVEALHLPAWRSLVNCARALASEEPLQARYSWSTALLDRVARLKSQFDVVHVEHLRAARYGINLGAASGSEAPVVWDSVDCISDLFEQSAARRRDAIGRLINQLELTRTRRYEGWLVPRFDRVLVTSGGDRDALVRLSGPQREQASRVVTVLPNGVDLEYFCPADEPRDADTVVFSGKMSYHANETAVVYLIQRVMPLVWAKRPSTRLVVVGKDPSSKLRRLFAEHAQQVTATGTVPDMRPHLRRASVAAVPLVYGVGCQNKVLEAMACGTPVVATPRAVAALQVQAGRNVLIADGPQAFADALVGLLDNPRAQRDIGRAGRAYVETHHRWDLVAARLEGIYEQAIAERAPVPVAQSLAAVVPHFC